MKHGLVLVCLLGMTSCATAPPVVRPTPYIVRHIRPKPVRRVEIPPPPPRHRVAVKKLNNAIETLTQSVDSATAFIELQSARATCASYQDYPKGCDTIKHVWDQQQAANSVEIDGPTHAQIRAAQKQLDDEIAHRDSAAPNPTTPTPATPVVPDISE
jgi:hypothetical protein